MPTTTAAAAAANTLEIHNHPWPKQPGSVLADAAYSLVWGQVLIEGGYLCSDSSNNSSSSSSSGSSSTSHTCDYRQGGVFTTQPALDVLFNGYLDPLVMRLLSKRYAARQLSFVCTAPDVTGHSALCEPELSLQCDPDIGFDVLHAAHGTVLHVQRTGEARHLWHSAELELPLGLGSVRNPVFAVHSGATWANETFQRGRECEDKRSLQGPAGLWRGYVACTHALTLAVLCIVRAYCSHSD
jgi:hypothetical protein